MTTFLNFPNLAKPGKSLTYPLATNIPDSIIACHGLLVKPQFAPEVEALDKLVMHGLALDLEQNERVGIAWTQRPGKLGIDALQSGTIIGISMVLNRELTAGSISAYVHLDGVPQNLPATTLTVSSGSQKAELAFATPIAFTAGTIIDAGVAVDGSFTPENSHALLAVWFTLDT